MRALTYIEVDVPLFDDERQAFFSAAYLTRGAGLTGAADSKLLTVSCWIWIDSGTTGKIIAGATTLGGGTSRCQVTLSASNEFQIVGQNAAGSQILNILSSPLPSDRWVHVVASVDLTDTGKRHIYVDGVSDLASVGTYTNDTMDFTVADYGVAGLPNGSSLFTGGLGDLWFQPGVYLDLSDEDVLALFIDTEGRPTDLGDDGSTPTGSAPLVFLSGALDTWHTNKGTGGGFTLTGILIEFEGLPTMYRFTYPCDYTGEAGIEAIPSLASIAHTPARISLGKDLGTRASVSVTFLDHKHIMNGEPYGQGTFFGKWRARYGTRLQGRSLRWIQGLLGQTLDEMETRHFIIDATEGPTPTATYSLVAKDILKLADGDKSLAPFPSNGFIVAGIDDNDLALSLSPTGIGNEEYPASGYAAIGGEEIVSFTRSGDAMTIVRAQLGTLATDHDAGERVQVVLRYVGEDPADILFDLLTNYAGIDPDFIPLSSWLTETDAYLQQNYSANIAEPTEVKKLINELIEQAALAMWWEPLTQLIRLQVLRAIPTTAATFDEENTLEGSLSVKEQPTTRVSQVFTYFGQRNPLVPIDQENNFRSSVLTIDTDAEFAYGQPAIKKVFSRWIPFGARTVAQRLNNLILGRYRDPPRRINFDLFRYNNEVDPELGGGFQLGSYTFQDVTGAAVQVPIQIVSLDPKSDKFEIEAEEMLFVNQDPADLLNRVITIDSAILNINLRELHDAFYPDPEAGGSPGESVRFIIEENVIVGSSSTAPSVVVGDWPVGYPVSLEVYGRIQGLGGAGGKGSQSGSNARDGDPGGDALYTRFPVAVTIFSGGGIWGGGGGGGGMDRQNDDGNLTGWGGGGGAGSLPGAAGASFRSVNEDEHAPTAGTTEEGGIGGGPTGSGFFPLTSGAGGDPGQAGQNTQGIPSGGADIKAGGAAGKAIDGVSFVSLTNLAGGNGIKGSTVN
jgi:hypothetical protein